MARKFFTITAIASAILAVLSFVLIFKQIINVPDDYEVLAICTIPLFAFISVLCFFVQSAIRNNEEKKYREENPQEGSMIRQTMISETSNSMEYSLYQLQLLGSKIVGIIGRVIATAIFVSFMGHGDLLTCLLWYIIVSYCWIFIKATGNYIIGIIAFIIFLFVILEDLMAKFGDKQELIVAAFLFGIVVIDAINIIRYIALRMKLASNKIKICRLSKEEMKAYKK